MARTPLEAAFDMEGAFNDLALSVSNDVNVEDVIARVDELIGRYGGLGAYARKDQLSHRYLSEEFKGLEQMAKTLQDLVGCCAGDDQPACPIIANLEKPFAGMDIELPSDSLTRLRDFSPTARRS